MNEDLQDTVSKAMHKAYQLGQKYWQQANSESYAQNKKSIETDTKFYELIDEVMEVIANIPNTELTGKGMEDLNNESRL